MNEVTLGSMWTMAGVLYKVTRICEEPNNGLVVIEDQMHPLKWCFTIPWQWLACDDRFRRFEG